MYSMVQRREKEKDSRYMQKTSAPAAGPCIRPVTSRTSVTIPAHVYNDFGFPVDSFCSVDN